ncbi:T9SS-dependent M36 family metallopeptidase [Hymenobacter crusticola]|uniref:Metalloprotease n=1 Tax=Hymenobacter crusticola TaxID=1770526 RepID=A0A243W859_9BACT|nr:T9SS-dependent M36 family metallopeptidase [Hymenobacter crusticola]OUJ69123.1 hypothetical protein BXP70_26925 [Hymenobacter crusticola]
MHKSFTKPACRVLAFACLLAAPGLASAQTTPLSSALSQFGSQRNKLGLSESDLSNPAVTSSYTEPASGITHVYLRQRYQGIEVYGAEADVHLNQANKLVSMHSNFVAGVAAQARAATVPALSAVQAVAAAATALNLGSPSGLAIEQNGQPATGLVFNEGGVSLEKIPVKLMYQARPSGELVLVWDVTIAPKQGNHYWNVRVDAATGQLVDKTDYTVSEPVSFADLARRSLATAAWPAPVASAKAATPNSYGVWPITVESPSHGARAVVTNPADATYSPFGWHDTNGVAGAEYTITRGNNVYAYEDRSKRDTPGYSPNGGTDLIFDFPFDQTLAAPTNQDAAITNLFYWNNLMHDVMAYKGFDEASGNFQSRNYTGAGTPQDYVQAEAQDGSDVNNANFSTPVDGSRPRMQMFLWPGIVRATLTVSSPASVAGTYAGINASFGRKLSATTPLTGNLVLVNDGATSTLGCTAPFINVAAVSGSIAVVDRGTCDFSLKVRNAQTAGAKAVIVINNIAGDPYAMGGTDTIGVKIPSLMISLADGNKLKTGLSTGASVAVSLLGSIPPPDRDGDYDNGVIAHEYGHGISTRLTGGPANSSCLPNNTGYETMGEGWSDFFGLWMTTKPGDKGETARGVGTYLSFESPTDLGIRSKPYSTDFAVNNYTYAQLGTTGDKFSETHAVGEVWCAMLWDLNWALVRKYGYNTDLKGVTGGNNIALKLVLDGCKLQPCTPGFVDGRNAILKADSLYNNAANASLIWQVFARRGLGYSAVQGSSKSVNDNTASFDLPAGVLATQKQLSEDVLAVYPNPANSQLTVRTLISSRTPVQVSLLTVLGTVLQKTEVPAAIMQQEGMQLNTTSLAAGLYLVKISTSDGIVTKKILVQH